MRFNIFFTIKGPAGISEIPITANPVEAISWQNLLIHLAGSIPYQDTVKEGSISLGLEVVGINIEYVGEQDESLRVGEADEGADE